MDTSLLKEIGLTDGEIKVYTALFLLGSTTTGPLVKESQVHSSKVYPILDRLIEKGLVSYIKEGKKTFYTANPPNTILSYLDKKGDEIQEQKKSAKDLINKLEDLSKTKKQETTATMFKGLKGIRTAFTIATKDLKKGEEVYAMFVPPVNKSLIPFYNGLAKSLSRKKVKNHMLFNEHCQEYENIKGLPLLKSRVGISREQKSPAEVCVYGENTIIATTGEGDNITILIKNEDVADSFRQQFEYIWKQDVFVSHGMKALTKTHEKTYDVLKKGEEYVCLGIPKYQPEEHHEYWQRDHLRRIKSGIKCRLLFNNNTPKSTLKNRNSYEGCDSRYMPIDIETPSYTFVYKDQVTMAIPKKEPIVIEIKNKEVADSFKAYFEAFWKLSKKFNYKKTPS